MHCAVQISTVRPRLWVNPASCPVGTGLFPEGWSGRGVKLTTHHHLAPKLGMLELYLYSPHTPMCSGA
jgi:hypothetical protein